MSTRSFHLWSADDRVLSRSRAGAQSLFFSHAITRTPAHGRCTGDDPDAFLSTSSAGGTRAIERALVGFRREEGETEGRDRGSPLTFEQPDGSIRAFHGKSPGAGSSANAEDGDDEDEEAARILRDSRKVRTAVNVRRDARRRASSSARDGEQRGRCSRCS